MGSQQNMIDTIIIGAGIIGVSTALELQSRGQSTMLLDRGPIASETSRGNAGAFAFSAIEPLATPGILKAAPKWLLDPLGPLSIPPSYLLNISPWLIKFWRASLNDRYVKALDAQTNLMAHCTAAFERQLSRFGDAAMIRREGQLELFQGKNAFEKANAKMRLKSDAGIAADLLASPDEIADIQPGLNKAFTHAQFIPEWFNVTNPYSWTQALARRYLETGGVFHTKTVQNICPSDDHIALMTTQGELRAKQIVICAGAWSHLLAAMIGDKIPLETERGYNTTFSKSSITLQTHLTFSAHGFAISRIDDGLRVGGAVELAGLRIAPNFRRSEILVEKAKMFIPDLEISDGTQWMGYRPTLPDSLPVIGCSCTSNRVLYAFGHGHVGLTQSAGTAELIADIISGAPTAINLNAFSAARF